MAIASAALFKIGANDLTRFITAPDYKVNRVPVTKNWTDANHIVHHRRVRDRIEGSFKVKFWKMEDYETFINLIEDNTVPDGYISCEVWLNNKLMASQGDFYLEFSPNDFLPFIGSKDYDGIEIKITER